MKNKKLFWSIFCAVALFAFILIFDLLSKHFVAKSLAGEGESQNVLPGFINLVFVKNTGAAWGMLAGRPIFLIIISIIVIALYITFYVLMAKKGNVSFWLSVSVGLIAGGCFGNLVDRIFLGYVRDFINFQFMNFPVFNVADIALTVGVICMIVYFLFFHQKDEKNKKVEQINDNSSENGGDKQ